jgi:hypothetical protein
MKKAILMAFILVIWGTATAVGRGPLKCKPSEVCSVKEVILYLDFGSLEKDNDASAMEETKRLVEENTWLRVVAVNPNPVDVPALHFQGELHWIVSTGSMRAWSNSGAGIGGSAHIGRTTAYRLLLWGPLAKTLWKQDRSDFEGTVATSVGDQSEAHEVHGNPDRQLDAMTRELNRALKGCGIKKGDE